MSAAVVQISVEAKPTHQTLIISIFAVQGSNSNRVTPICEEEDEVTQMEE